jgi:hypothetical protein
VLIDRTHRWWIIVTSVLAVAATGLYVFLYLRTPGGLTGGSLVGMWYGVAGSALMVFAGLLSGLRQVPTWRWLGPRQLWLRGHIWLGLLSGVLILCHSGGRFGGPLECFLMVVVLLTLATGVVGLLLQSALPRLLTLQVPHEAPYDQIPYLCQRLRQEADALLAEAETDDRLPAEARREMQRFYEGLVRPFLAPVYDRTSTLADPLRTERAFEGLRDHPGMAVEAPYYKDRGGTWKRGSGEPSWSVLSWLRTCCEQRRQMGEQERLQFWLHSWLLLHVPLSVMLLVLGVTHVVTALYY